MKKIAALLHHFVMNQLLYFLLFLIIHINATYLQPLTRMNEVNQFIEECTVSMAYCTNTSVAVLNGLDFVQFFTEFKLLNHTYNESAIGTVGLPQYSYVFNNYTFFFKSNHNLRLFQSSPSKYVPKVMKSPYSITISHSIMVLCSLEDSVGIP